MKVIKDKKIIYIAIQISFLVFLYLYNFKVLNPTYTEWLMNREDLTQHFMGWEFFRKSNWNFPLGLIKGLIYPDRVSVIFMDAIPNFAIFFKIFSFILPQKFQYFGLFGLISFIFMAIISGLILREYTDNIKVIIIFILFTILSPVFLARVFVHTSLASQWLILSGILLWVKKEKMSSKNKIILWNILFLFLPGIHAYFIPMLFLILFGYILEDYFKNKRIKINIFLYISSVFSTLISMYFIGYFYGNADNNFEFGYYNANMNTFFNPLDWSRFIKNVKLFTEGQYEGFAYMGVGLLGLLFLNLDIFKKKENKFKILVIIIAFILSISPYVSIGKIGVFEINYPDIIEKIMGVFKTNGRFIWVSYYLLLFLIFENICKKNKKEYIIYLFFLLQIADLSPKLIEIHNNFREKKEFKSKLESKFWEEIKKDKYKIMMFMDEEIVFSGYIWDLSKIAIDYKLDINNSYIARRNINQINKTIENYLNRLEQKEVIDGILFVFNNPTNKINKYYNLNYYIIDNFIIGTTKEYLNYPKYNFNNFDFKVLHINENSKKTIESIELYQYGIQYGPYTQLEKGKYTIKINGSNLDKAGFEVKSKDINIPILEIQNFKNKISYNIELDKNFYDIEFKIYNSTEEIIKIKNIEIEKK